MLTSSGKWFNEAVVFTAMTDLHIINYNVALKTLIVVVFVGALFLPFIPDLCLIRELNRSNKSDFYSAVSRWVLWLPM